MGIDHTIEKTSSSRRGDIQGLRAIAVALVVVFHAGAGFPGGFVGVDVFFVISGYVITRMLLAERASSGRVSLTRFYLRRIRRILPALAVLLVTVIALSPLLAPVGGREITVRTGAAAAVISANTYLISSDGGGYFDASTDLNALLHTWSLSVEEQFYIVFPAVLLAGFFVAIRRGASMRHVAAAVLGVILAISFTLSLILSTGSAGNLPSDSAATIAFYSAPTRAWEFAVGGLLAAGAPLLARLGRRSRTTAAVLGLLGIGTAALMFDGGTSFPGTAALLPVIATALVIGAGENRAGNRLTPLLASRPMQFIGDLSYSWYLWHWPLIVFAVALWQDLPGVGMIAGAASLVPAWLSFRFVETPIRHAPRLVTWRTVRLGAACVIGPVLAAAAVSVVDFGRTEFDIAFRHHDDHVRACDTPWSLVERDRHGCEWLVSDPVGTSVLLGDSNAGQFTSAFVRGSNAARYDALVATGSLCPFVDLVLIDSGVANGQCAAFVDRTLQALIEVRPDVVFLAAASDGYIELDEFELQDPETGLIATTREQKTAAWSTGLARTVQSLQRYGIRPVVVHPIPKFPDWDPRACLSGRWMARPEACGATIDADLAQLRRSNAVAAERAVAERLHVTVIDPFDELCGDTVCRTQTGSTWMWRDGSHLSVDGSLVLSDLFQSAIV